MKKLLLAFFLLLPIYAWALSLSEARSQGLVAENDHGYIEAVVNRSDVSALVNEVNSKRKNEYARIAGQTNASIDEVESISAKKIIEALPSGSLVKINGTLSKK